MGLITGLTNLKKAGLEGTFTLGNVERIGLEDNTFDIVFSRGLIEHFEDVRLVFKEMVRVLRSAGLFAADVIPKRFSCMSLAYFLAFLIQFFPRIFRLQFRGSIKESRRNLPFYENSTPLKEYRRIAKESGLENVVTTGTGPLPALPLPHSLHPGYAKLMEKMMLLWRRFNRSNSGFTEFWGARYAVYRVKKA